MKSHLDKDQIEDLLINVLDVEKVGYWKGDKIQFCCPVHQESTPSCGINIDYCPSDNPEAHLQVFHCFACQAGGTIPWLMFKAKPDKFKSVASAVQFLKDRYAVSFAFTEREESGIHIMRYEDLIDIPEDKRYELPRYMLAIYKSGKETYQYFYDRGFSKEDVKEYMIGRDLDSETVTIPVFWEDGVLAGLIGRYIDPKRPKNMRFRIYGFPKSGLIFPLDKVVPQNDTLIVVEAIFDAIMLRKWGYKNAIALMGDGMSSEQANQIASRCNKLIDLTDRDAGGDTALSLMRSKLHNQVSILAPTYYPEKGKDPLEWGESETRKVIASASYKALYRIPLL